MPLAMSSRPTIWPARVPTARATLVPPMLPLPTEKMLTPCMRAMIQAVGMEPSR